MADVPLKTLVAHLDGLLDAARFADYGPNGLQVEGRGSVRRVVVGVTACLELIEKAAALGADAILVHHGILWGGTPTLTGSFGRRVRTLMRHDLSLIAYHLPLDAHLGLGNGASLARRLGVTDLVPFGMHKGMPVGVRGVITPEADGAPVSAATFATRITSALGVAPLVYPHGPPEIRTIGIVTGGAERDIDQAVAAGLDAFLTGEVSEPTLHTAREDGIHFFSAGHHATERYGVQSLAAHLEATFGLECHFVDVPNPA
jgi:dinuclear metal center YbgI/SA1388 family protein